MSKPLRMGVAGREEWRAIMNSVLPIVIVVLFWVVAFVFAFRFTVRALQSPTEAEIEHAAHEAEVATPSR